MSLTKMPQVRPHNSPTPKKSPLDLRQQGKRLVDHPIVLEEPGPLVRVALQLAAEIDAGSIEGAWAWWIWEGEKAGGGMDGSESGEADRSWIPLTILIVCLRSSIA